MQSCCVKSILIQYFVGCETLRKAWIYIGSVCSSFGINHLQVTDPHCFTAQPWTKPDFSILDPFFNKSGLFLSSPWPTHIVLAAYLLFVLRFGKKFMENRKPFNIKNIVRVYNIIQVTFNAIIFGYVSIILFWYTTQDSIWSYLHILNRHLFILCCILYTIFVVWLRYPLTTRESILNIGVYMLTLLTKFWI